MGSMNTRDFSSASSMGMYGRLPSVKGSEVWAPVLQVHHGVLMGTVYRDSKLEAHAMGQ